MQSRQVALQTNVLRGGLRITIAIEIMHMRLLRSYCYLLASCSRSARPLQKPSF
eukprot:COSAG06_NODE_48256_length_333_cov_0.978632_1_plen_53_part_10